MKKFLIVLLLSIFFAAGLAAGTAREGIMGYCALEDLEGAYGADRITGWSRMDSAAIDRAIRNASAEIDGYLISGGYTVPLAGPPENLKKYCIDIAAANLILSAGVLDNDPGGKAVLEEAKNARHFLEKVAEGKFKIPGYSDGDTEVSMPPGGIRVSALPRMDLRGF